MKFKSLKKNVDFKRVFKTGKAFFDPYFVFYVSKNNISFFRIGITVSKKVGGAVVRNRIKRLVKEVFRLEEVLKPGFCKDYLDIVVVAKRTSAKIGFYDVQRSVFSFLCFLKKNFF